MINEEIYIYIWIHEWIFIRKEMKIPPIFIRFHEMISRVSPLFVSRLDLTPSVKSFQKYDAIYANRTYSVNRYDFAIRCFAVYSSGTSKFSGTSKVQLYYSRCWSESESGFEAIPYYSIISIRTSKVSASLGCRRSKAAFSKLQLPRKYFLERICLR